MLLERTPMDYLDFASPDEGLAGKMGIDATTKIGAKRARLGPGHGHRARGRGLCRTAAGRDRRARHEGDVLGVAGASGAALALAAAAHLRALGAQSTSWSAPPPNGHC